MTSNIVRHYKIVIIGAGPAGSSCAIALSRKGVKNILMLESGEYDKFRIGETIPPETKTIFLKLGIFNAFLEEGHDPCYGSCSYWGDSRRGYNDTILSPYGHGWHLDRRRFDYFLSQQAQAAGAELISNSEFLHSKQLENGGFKLVVRNSKRTQSLISAGFVIDATGSRSVFASQQGSKKINTDPLVCLGVRFKIDKSSQVISKQTHLESVEYGWWYAACLPNDILLVALYTDSETIKEMGLQRIQTWLDLLGETQNTRKLISNTKIMDEKTRAFPAPSFQLDRVVGNNWMAIGDAASTFDPITSQGIIKSMSDAILAAEIIVKHISTGVKKLEEFEQNVAARYEQYLNMRKYLYQLENRWPEAPFWQRQHQNICTR